MSVYAEPSLALPAEDAISRLKEAMRRVAQTVTVLTTRCNGTQYGMTASAFTSVSMDPPSIMVAINNQAGFAVPLQERGAFVVNILSADQTELAMAFSDRSLTPEERFSRGVWADHPLDLPYTPKALASLVCTTDHATRYGTHTIFIGKVQDVLLSGDEQPLIWLGGGFVGPTTDRG